MTRTERIRLLAYYTWLADGQPSGCDVQHWLESERIVDDQIRREQEVEQRRRVLERYAEAVINDKTGVQAKRAFDWLYGAGRG